MIELTTLQSTPTYLIAIITLVLILVLYNVGYRTRIWVLKNNPDQSTIELSAINGTLLGLLGLLLAFTFSMASARFDTRRQLIIEEANDIGTVILRTDIYPDSVRKVLRINLKQYVEERITFYQVGMDLEKALLHYNKADSIGKLVWSTVANYAKADNITTRTSEIIPALNAMIDITTTRRAAG
ncbi:MAG TPA: hypothetical protein PKU83_11140, partial [Chryseolinea sp.]|nr:hypothetical protein [Chryseolinea sp.]